MSKKVVKVLGLETFLLFLADYLLMVWISSHGVMTDGPIQQGTHMAENQKLEYIN
jgi:hypothetical protein